MKLFLSHAGLNEVKGGVELYAQQLGKVFPGTKIIDYHSFKDELGDSFTPLFREPARAKKLGEKIMREYPDAEIFSNGMFCWNLPHKNQINICHGTYAGLSESAVPKTNPDFFRLRFIYNHYEKLAAKNAKIIIANSKKTSENIKRFFSLDSHVIYPPVDFQIFSPSSQENAQSKLGWTGINILFVGRAEYAKGFDFIEHAAQRNPECTFQCILSRPYAPKLPNIHIIEPKSHSELALYYNAADLILFPSRFEGFGFVIAEALACNKKIVCLHTGIASEFKANNLFIAEPNIESIQSSIKTALASDKNPDSRERAEKLFSKEVFRTSWVSTLNHLGL